MIERLEGAPHCRAFGRHGQGLDVERLVAPAQRRLEEVHNRGAQDEMREPMPADGVGAGRVRDIKAVAIIPSL